MRADHSDGPNPIPSLNAERALHCCVAAFGGPGACQAGEFPAAWLAPEWRDRMAADGSDLPVVPDAALRALERSHRLQAHVDCTRVHPSWLVRAGQEETPALRGLFAGHGISPDAAPEIAGWAQALATERLVGGEPVTRLDPPPIVAIGGLSPRSAFRLADAAGRAKLALADGPARAPSDPRPERARWFLERLVPRLGGDEEKLRQWAGRERQRAEQSTTRPAQTRAFLGMTTLARLLAACEPFRVRWALQHLPYPIAKRFRAIMSSPGQAHPLLLQIEDVVLKTAWERLALENRIDLPYPEPIARPGHAP